MPETLLSGTFRPFPGKRQIQGALDYPSDQNGRESQECVFPGTLVPGNRLIRIHKLFVLFGAGSVFLDKSGKILSVLFGAGSGKRGKVARK